MRITQLVLRRRAGRRSGQHRRKHAPARKPVRGEEPKDQSAASQGWLANGGCAKSTTTHSTSAAATARARELSRLHAAGVVIGSGAVGQ